ncbi:hypothetical protein ACKVEX_08540 [Rhodocyclaceae bacterium SMB388]
MPRNQNRLPDGASLDQQIRIVEQRMIRHRASSKARLVLFRAQLRDRMTSPLALLLAAGVGFAMGPSRVSKHAQPPAEAPPRADGVQLLSTIVSWVSLTGSVMTLWQRFRADSPPTGRERSATEPQSKKNTPS